MSGAFVLQCRAESIYTDMSGAFVLQCRVESFYTDMSGASYGQQCRVESIYTDMRGAFMLMNIMYLLLLCYFCVSHIEFIPQQSNNQTA